MIQLWLTLKEAVASARAQRTTSFLTIAMCFAMVAAVMMTTGRTVGAQESVLASIDSAGTRTVTIRSQANPALTAIDLDRLGALEGIEWLAGFSRAYDAVNSDIPQGQRVAMRFMFGPEQDGLGVHASPSPHLALAFASGEALNVLGLQGPGPITRVDGPSYDIATTLSTPDFLEELEPLILSPGLNAPDLEPVTTIKFVVTDVNLVRPVTGAVIDLLSVQDPATLTVETSTQLAQISEIIGKQLNASSRELIALIFAVTAAILTVILYGLVMMRRKDFGRRRALGASRSLVVSLLILQTALLALIGITLGAITSITALLLMNDPVPSAAFAVALCILALTAALLSSVIPAFVASRRDPIKELRVP